MSNHTATYLTQHSLMPAVREGIISSADCAIGLTLDDLWRLRIAGYGQARITARLTLGETMSLSVCEGIDILVDHRCRPHIAQIGAAEVRL
jgi:hypothetical protein